MTTPWGPIGYLVYKRTYARSENGSSEEFVDTIERIIKACDTQLKMYLSEEEKQDLRDIFLNLKGLPAGRFLWQLGTKTVDTLGMASLQNCFSADTEFMTKEGIKKFSDFKHNQSIVVRGKDKWVSAKVKSFGSQPIVELTVKKGARVKIIKTTANHRWILKDNSIVSTSNLITGDTLKTTTKKTNFHNLRMCPTGIQHGLVYGDGNWNENAKACAITICGDSIEETKHFFRNYDTSKKEISGLPWNWKKLPNLAEVNKHYLYGLLAGWFAADGSINKKGCAIVLASSKKTDLQWVRGALSKLDITTSDINLSREFSPFDGSYKPLFRITLDKETVPEEFFLLKKHKSRYTSSKLKREWVVVNVKQTNNPETVWCVEEPNKEEFALSSGILTKNCASTVIDQPVRPFVWAMDMLMLGCGVGYNLQKKYISKIKPKVRHVEVTRQDNASADFIVPDSREGWCRLLEKVLNSHFFTGENFSYSTHCVRGKGAPISKFGGVASGPEILCDGISKINKVLNNRAGQKLEPIDALDIMNIIGSIVVAGNVRRSAQLSIGDADDDKFLSAKRWDLGNIPNWRDKSNNSVVCSDVLDLPETFWDSFGGGGECIGLINLKLSRDVGRLGETKYNDPEITGYNPCAEQSLESYETCCLAEIFLPNIRSSEELLRVAKYLYRINKHSLALKCHHGETSEVVHKNYRMGIGITGYLQSNAEQRGWLSEVYSALRSYDISYSKQHGFPESIKLTTCKPSGTMSVLAGVTHGAHPGFSQYFIRRVRVASDSPLIDVCAKAGYPMEFVKSSFDNSVDHSTMVIEFPCRYPEGTVLAKDCSAIDQLKTIQEIQTNWSDNSVSCTVYYKLCELPEIRKWLEKNYKNGIKTVSFMLHEDHGFKQAPYEEITKEEYDQRIAMCSPITKIEVKEKDVELEECETGACPVK